MPRNAFAVALDAAGDRFLRTVDRRRGPSCWCADVGAGVFCRPFAGTVARSSDPDTDRRRARSLQDSAKDLAEHAFVVDFLRERLAPFCSAVEAPDEPELLSTGELWHLATPVSGYCSTRRRPCWTWLWPDPDAGAGRDAE